MSTALESLFDAVRKLGSDSPAQGEPGPTWDDAALLCARTINNWGGRLGRAALLAQLQGEDRERAGASSGRGAEAPFTIDVRIEAIEIVPGGGSEHPLVLATVRQVDTHPTSAPIEMALPERLCALSNQLGMSALVAPGRLLRVDGALALAGGGALTMAACAGALQWLSSEVATPLLDATSEHDDMLSSCSVSHTLSEVNADAFAQGTRFTLLCRIKAVEVSTAMRTGWARSGGAAPPEANSGERLWARVFLSDGSEAADSTFELLLLGSHTQLVNCIPTVGENLLLIHPFVQSGGAGRVVLRYGQATVLAPIERGLGREARCPGDGAVEVVAVLEGGGARRERAVLGTLVEPAGASSLKPTRGGRVRALVRQRRAAIAAPLAEIQTEPQGAALVRLCAPAEAFAQLWTPAESGGDPRAPSKEQGVFVLACVQIGPPGVCSCVECVADAADPGDASERALDASELYLFADGDSAWLTHSPQP
ncbi:hypothetical protein T492DRAFT_1108852 [Pavlovales sp. CCMP2436]|nr:hypothetical protein T492DRAFT_1108852 [Pavlovales sp. CCMP2436]